LSTGRWVAGRVRAVLYTDIVTTCYIVSFRISKPNPDPFRRI